MDRTIEVAVDAAVVPAPPETVEYVEVPTLPTSALWAHALLELAVDLEMGRIDSAHFAAIARASIEVNNALTRRMIATNQW